MSGQRDARGGERHVRGPGGEPRGESLLYVTEFTDAACPWAWGAEPDFRLLRQTLGERAEWRQVFGILFDEDDDPAPDPDAEARWYERFIADVAAHTGAPYATRLHWLTRTSWPASQAVTAARAQGGAVAQRVLRRLRETTFVLGTPADTPDGVRDAVLGVPGLDTGRLLRDLDSADVRAAVRADHAETREPLPEVWDLEAAGPHPGRAKELADGHRYALPTLLFEGAGGRVVMPGRRAFAEYLDAARTAAGAPLPGPVRLPPEAALARWRSLTGPELTALTGSPAEPAGAVRIDTANGPVLLRPDEARTHPMTRLRAAE